jgi:hypothetical protein
MATIAAMITRRDVTSSSMRIELVSQEGRHLGEGKNEDKVEEQFERGDSV